MCHEVVRDRRVHGWWRPKERLGGGWDREVVWPWGSHFPSEPVSIFAKCGHREGPGAACGTNVSLCLTLPSPHQLDVALLLARVAWEPMEGIRPGLGLAALAG